MIVIVSQDLMMTSSANAVARRLSRICKPASTMAKALGLINSEDVSLLLVDLQLPGLEISEAGVALNSLAGDKRPYCVAYAQHVNVDLIEDAQQQGFDQVLTRGQLNRDLDALFNR